MVPRIAVITTLLRNGPRFAGGAIPFHIPYRRPSADFNDHLNLIGIRFEGVDGPRQRYPPSD